MWIICVPLVYNYKIFLYHIDVHVNFVNSIYLNSRNLLKQVKNSCKISQKIIIIIISLVVV